MDIPVSLPSRFGDDVVNSAGTLRSVGVRAPDWLICDRLAFFKSRRHFAVFGQLVRYIEGVNRIQNLSEDDNELTYSNHSHQ